jgi:hypothetical protein
VRGEGERLLNEILEEFEGLSRRRREEFIQKNLTREVMRVASVLGKLEGREASRDFLILYALLSITEKRLGHRTSRGFKIACAMYGALKSKKLGEIADYIM